MKITRSQKDKLRLMGQIILAGNILAAAFVFFKFGLENSIIFINGLFVGTAGGLLVSLMEFFFLQKNRKHIKFIWLLLFKFCIYLFFLTIILLGVSVISRMMRFDLSYQDVLVSESFQEYIWSGSFKIEVVYALTFAFIINFSGMMSRKMGQGMFLAFLKGTYYLPQKQVRAVMFLKLNHSKEALRLLGPLEHHNYLNQVFSDIAEDIVNNRGVIHEYIDDLVVITWQLNDKFNLENCIRLYFDVKENLKSRNNSYMLRFNLQPEVTTSLHVGSMVASEMGEVKTQIVLLGDTLNTTARILEKGEELKIKFLASKEIVKLDHLPNKYLERFIGDIALKGKKERLALCEIVKSN